MVRFGNWQEFLDKSLHNLQVNCSRFEHFKKLKSNKERLHVIAGLHDSGDWKWVNTFFSSLALSSNQKSVAEAKYLRLEGNKLFVKKEYKPAVLCYNESVLFAPVPDSDAEISLAIANRSAAFYHLNEFQLCLNDIKLALKYDYPKNLQYKLFQRAGQCHVRMKNIGAAIEAFQTAHQLVALATFEDENKKECVLEEIMNKLSNLIHNEDNPSKVVCGDIAPLSSSRHHSEHCLPQPAYGLHDVLLQASCAVDVKYSDNKGRYLVANRSLKAGDVIIVERPFAFVLLPTHYGKRCHHCLAKILTAFPCRCCSTVSYCSEQCSSESWEKYHSIECRYQDLFSSVGIAHLSLRIVLQAGLEYLSDAKGEIDCKDNGAVAGVLADGTYGCNYPAVYHLMPHTDSMATEDLFQYTMTAYLLLLCLDHGRFFGSKPDEEVRWYIGSLLLRHICQLVCNAHAITEVDRNPAAYSLAVDTSSQVRVATAIYPTASLMNHSCDPTIISSFHNDKLVVRAVKDVEAGDEIFNCYGPHCKRMPRAERQQHLNEQYFFNCTCTACGDEFYHDQLQHAFLCHRCSGPVVAAKNKIWKCTNCNHVASPEEIVQLLKNVQEADKLWTKGIDQLHRAAVNDALGILLKTLEHRQKSLYRHNKDLAQVHDAIAQCYVHRGEYELASRYLSDSIASTEAIYGATSIELANELLKYAEVSSKCSGQDELTRTLGRRAVDIFTLNYGVDCDAAVEVRQLLSSLSLR